MLKLAEKNALPGYALTVETARDGEPMLRMIRIDGKDGAETALAPAKPVGAAGPPSIETEGKLDRTARPTRAGEGNPPKTTYPGDQKTETIDARQLIRRTVAGLSDAATRGIMTEQTILHLRETCPGWDLYALHAEFERWVGEDAERTPVDWQKAFIGWVKRHHKANRHQLRGG